MVSFTRVSNKWHDVFYQLVYLLARNLLLACLILEMGDLSACLIIDMVSLLADVISHSVLLIYYSELLIYHGLKTYFAFFTRELIVDIAYFTSVLISPHNVFIESVWLLTAGLIIDITSFTNRFNYWHVMFYLCAFFYYWLNVLFLWILWLIWHLKAG